MALLVVCFAFMYIFVYVLLIRHLAVSSWHVVFNAHTHTFQNICTGPDVELF